MPSEKTRANRKGENRLSGRSHKDRARQTLDLRGLKCPLPALFARRALAKAPPGTEIEVLADDPMARIDVPHMCRQEGYDVVGQRETPSGSQLILRRPQ
jgi:tRNA 2-thiouridine synthesizing protein A